ncbi:transcription factor TCP23-like [Hibiscus syriacus]|uniref:Transcription factor TCP23-like n=1 Tax=Hibiscus syriacus TaxID=106335 RepID=A0A6A3AF93_HIBSY|nr:transcription factor TCP23-like [Hibiscus syriacus]
MALNGGIRSASKLLNSSSQLLLHKSAANRGFHSTGVKRMGGGHGHDEPYYLHAKHMYNLDRMKHQKLKMSLGVLTAFSIGVFVPVYAVIFQQKKTASG